MKRHILRLFLSLAICSSLWGCTHQGDSVVLAGDGTRLSSEEIDRDPLALLPSGPVSLTHLDAQAAFASQLGEPVAKLMTKAVPLGAESNFDPKRDIKRIIVGAYSLQGADLAMVVQGNFDPEAIRQAASKGVQTALGAPLTKLSYAGNDLFVAGGIGFVVVTKKTLIAGNETGIRRCLDRIRDNRLKRDVPEWMVKLLDNPQAPVVSVADLSREPQVGAVAQQFPFVQGVSVARVLGNFQSPGINFAGAITYTDASSAERGEASLKQLSNLASLMQMLSMLGVKSPISDLQVRKEQQDVQFIVAVDSQGAAAMLDVIGAAIAKPKASR